MSCLSACPEELLHAIAAHTDPPALLLVSSAFYRIALPLCYRALAIRSPRQLQRLLAHALRQNPRLPPLIRHIALPALWPLAGELLCHARHSLASLDLTLDSVLNSHAPDPDAELFCSALHQLSALTHIVVRKPNNVYLTRPKLQYVLSEMAKAMHNWPDLEYVDLAFRLSDDSGGTAALLTILPVPLPVHHRPRSTKLPGPVTQLTQVLSSRPKLHTFSTHLPNVWNENILRVSQNPALHRIILVDGQGTALKAGITGTGHFFAQAKRYPRLSDLIRAGTSITRCRAQTTASPCSNSGCTFGHQTPHDSPHAYALLDREPAASSSFPSSSSPSPRSSSTAPSWQRVSHPWERYHSSSSSSTPGGSTSIRPSLPLSTSAP